MDSLVHLNNIFHTPFPLFGSSRNGCRNDWNNGSLGRLEYIKLDIALLLRSVYLWHAYQFRLTSQQTFIVDDCFFHDTFFFTTHTQLHKWWHKNISFNRQIK